MQAINYGYARASVKGEDFILAATSLNLFGVFDGVGGRPGGGEASRTAAEAIRLFYAAHADQDEPAAVTAALESAEVRLHKRRQNDSRLSTMATTATIARIYAQASRPMLAYGHVGDTRLYLLRNHVLRQITEDEGSGNVLEQALGFLDAIAQTDVMPLFAGDRLLLCSDGITGDFPAELLSSEEIQAALDPNHNPHTAAKALVQLSRKHDDASALVIDIP